MDDALKPINAPELTIVLPSGATHIIREQNGDDDEILSKIKYTNDGEAMARFIAAITIKDGTGKKPNFEDILTWPSNDVYVTLLKSRINSLGNGVEFSMICPKENCETETSYSEDLSKFDWDYSKPFPTNQSKLYKPFACKPYPEGTKKEFILVTSSGKKIKWNLLDAASAKLILELPEDNLSRNIQLTMRKASIETGGKFMLLTHFGLLSARDMTELRKDIGIKDPEFPFYSHVTCSNPKCKFKSQIPVPSQSTFFFPVT